MLRRFYWSCCPQVLGPDPVALLSNSIQELIQEASPIQQSTSKQLTCPSIFSIFYARGEQLLLQISTLVTLTILLHFLARSKLWSIAEDWGRGIDLIFQVGKIIVRSVYAGALAWLLGNADVGYAYLLGW